MIFIMIFKMYVVIALYFIQVLDAKVARPCPLKCPTCTMCDVAKGTCTLPRDFVTCTSKTLPGVCMAGGCNTKLRLPKPIIGLNKCQTYNCPVSGLCVKKSKPDGTDCSSIDAEFHSACVSGVCKKVIDALVEPMPFSNIGCFGLPDGTICDTNESFIDGEKCVGGVCKFPDGTYYGYI